MDEGDNPCSTYQHAPAIGRHRVDAKITDAFGMASDELRLDNATFLERQAHDDKKREIVAGWRRADVRPIEKDYIAPIRRQRQILQVRITMDQSAGCR